MYAIRSYYALRLRISFGEAINVTDFGQDLIEKVLVLIAIIQDLPAAAFGLSGDLAVTYESEIRTIQDEYMNLYRESVAAKQAGDTAKSYNFV